MAAPHPAHLPSHGSNIEVIMIVRDEEVNLPHSIGSVRGWVERVWVVDSGSTDRTVEIAKSLGAEVVHQPWLGYARQKNWALHHLPLRSDWVLILDADESVLPELRQALCAVAARPAESVHEAAFHVNRHFVFLGGVVRHCGYYPSWNVRFLKRGRARYEERDVHEHMVADGPTGFLAGELEHNDRRPLEHLIAKHNRYSTLEARAILAQRQPDRAGGLPARLFGTPLERRRWVKRHVYPRLPARFLCRFVWMYFLKLGFLDGVTGWRFCLFISAYELQIDQKLAEMEIEAVRVLHRSRGS
jgi:glycosyltransferase involved in cell wall biosynthesis